MNTNDFNAPFETAQCGENTTPAEAPTDREMRAAALRVFMDLGGLLRLTFGSDLEVMHRRHLRRDIADDWETPAAYHARFRGAAFDARDSAAERAVFDEMREAINQDGTISINQAATLAIRTLARIIKPGPRTPLPWEARDDEVWEGDA